MHIRGDFPAEEVSPTLIFHPSNTLSNRPELDYNPEISFLQLCWPFIITPQTSYFAKRLRVTRFPIEINTQNTGIEKLMVWKIKKKGQRYHQSGSLCRCTLLSCLRWRKSWYEPVNLELFAIITRPLRATTHKNSIRMFSTLVDPCSSLCKNISSDPYRKTTTKLIIFMKMSSQRQITTTQGWIFPFNSPRNAPGNRNEIRRRMETKSFAIDSIYSFAISIKLLLKLFKRHFHEKGKEWNAGSTN